MGDRNDLYPRPGPTGGRLIREVISFLRASGADLPIGSHILIAVSGGPDSIALAHLLIRYGRKIIDRSRITLLHVNHGWRGEESDQDARFVRGMAKNWGVPVRVIRARAPKEDPRAQGRSWEEHARSIRKRIFKREGERGALILTAHQADDLAETWLWRACTGSALTHGGGIRVRTDHELRPLLRIRKRTLQEFLREEGIPWCEDSTNQGSRFLRARMRQELMPAVERLFPKAISHLVELALSSQEEAAGNKSASAACQTRKNHHPIISLLKAARVPMRRANWDDVRDALQQVECQPAWRGELHLPEGWLLKRERGVSKRGKSHGEKWVLEKK